MAYETSNRSGLDRDPDRIETDIESTRSRIEARLDALTNEFTPSTLMDRALGVNEADAEHDTFSLMIERARTNPMSAALIAAGLAGMVLNRPDPRAQAAQRAADERYPIEPYSADPAERIGHHIDTLETQAENLSTSAKATASGIAASVSSAVSGAVDSVTGAVDGARERMSSASRDTRSAYYRTRYQAGQTGSEWSDAARHAPTQARAGAEYAADWVRENPVTAGLFALAAGATAASLFAAQKANNPRSRAEAAEELHERAEREAAERAARRAAVATATARAKTAQPKTAKPAAAKTTAKRSAAPRKPAAAAKTAASSKAIGNGATRSPTSAATRSSSGKTTLGKNLDRSTAVQGKPSKT